MCNGADRRLPAWGQFALRGLPEQQTERALSRRIRHILHKYPVTPRRIILEDMSYRTNQLVVLNNRTSAYGGKGIENTGICLRWNNLD